MGKYFHISKSNPVRFAKRVDFATSYKNDENTLSCEVDVRLPYKEVQLWENNDIVQNQFKSGFATNKVFVIKEDLSEEQIVVVKKSQNFDNLVKLDAKIKDSGTKTLIYFTAGNNYDPGTANVLNTYILNGALPIWAKVGQEITFNGVTKEIQEIFYDEILNADVLLINNFYTGASTNTIVDVSYDLENFEVFEFSISMDNYENQKIRVKIVSSKDLEVLEHLSEEIFTTENHLETVNIKYKNSTNTDVNFGTGIEFELRQKASFINGISDESSEKYKTDTNVILLNSDIYEGDEFIFHPVTKEMMRKLVAALSHDNLFINDIGYVKSEQFEKEGPLGDTNFYHLKAKMLKNGLIYEKKSPPIVVPKILTITSATWSEPNSGGGKDITINWSANFPITNLGVQLAENEIDWSPIIFDGINDTNPLLTFNRTEINNYVRIADKDVNGNIIYSNSVKWFEPSTIPSVKIRWADTQNDVDRTGSQINILVEAFEMSNAGNVINVDYELTWLIYNIPSNGWTDTNQHNTTYNFSLLNGQNKIKLVITNLNTLDSFTTDEMIYSKIASNPIVTSTPITCSGSNFGGSAPSCGNSGTLTINSGSHTIRAIASIYTNSTTGVTVNITVDGVSMSVSNGSGQGQDHYSTSSIIRGPGTYSYSYTVIFSGNNGSAGGGIDIS